MKTLARTFVVLALLAAPVVAVATAQDLGPRASLPASKDLYSFADLYRIAVAAGEGGAELPAPWSAAEGAPGAQFRVRTVAGGAPGAAQAAYAFSIGRVAEQPPGGLLLFAGLAAALWVARRRLGFPIRR